MRGERKRTEYNDTTQQYTPYRAQGTKPSNRAFISSLHKKTVLAYPMKRSVGTTRVMVALWFHACCRVAGRARYASSRRDNARAPVSMAGSIAKSDTAAHISNPGTAGASAYAGTSGRIDKDWARLAVILTRYKVYGSLCHVVYALAIIFVFKFKK